ncbi:hypothetical protein HDR63_01815 [bacterium]|nr:hypothetical protein [bacterium]
MDKKTFEKFDAWAQKQRIPKDAVLSPESINAMNSAYETALLLRKSLADYFERQGKPMDERARHLDQSLGDRAMFLNLMRFRFDAERALKRVREFAEEYYSEEFYKAREERAKAFRQMQREMEILTPYDWLTAYGPVYGR